MECLHEVIYDIRCFSFNKGIGYQTEEVIDDELRQVKDFAMLLVNCQQRPIDFVS